MDELKKTEMKSVRVRGHVKCCFGGRKVQLPSLDLSRRPPVMLKGSGRRAGPANARSATRAPPACDDDTIRPPAKKVKAAATPELLPQSSDVPPLSWPSTRDGEADGRRSWSPSLLQPGPRTQAPHCDDLQDAQDPDAAWTEDEGDDVDDAADDAAPAVSSATTACKPPAMRGRGIPHAVASILGALATHASIETGRALGHIELSVEDDGAVRFTCRLLAPDSNS